MHRNIELLEYTPNQRTNGSVCMIRLYLLFPFQYASKKQSTAALLYTLNQMKNRIKIGLYIMTMV